MTLSHDDPEGRLPGLFQPDYSLEVVRPAWRQSRFSLASLAWGLTACCLALALARFAPPAVREAGMQFGLLLSLLLSLAGIILLASLAFILGVVLISYLGFKVVAVLVTWLFPRNDARGRSFARSG